jgi:uncharacterized protein (DUF1330 family)
VKRNLSPRNQHQEGVIKLNRTLLMSLVAGAVAGAAVLQGVSAQTKSPVYDVIEFDEITDPTGYAAIGARAAEAAAAVFKDSGGRYLARTDKVTGLDGIAPKRSIIIAFDSKEKVQAWYNSAAQKEITAIRSKTTKSLAFVVEGM